MSLQSILRWLGGQIAVNIAAVTILSALGVVGSMYHTLQQGLGPLAPVAAVCVAVLVLGSVPTAINQISATRERSRSNRANPTPAEVETLIRQWLYEFSFQIRNDPQSYAHFQIEATDSEERKVTIFQRRDEPHVTIATKLSFAPGPTLTAIQAPKSNFFQDLGVQLTQLDVEWRWRRPESDIHILQLVMVDRDMTGLAFVREVARVRRGYGIVQMMFDRAAHDISP